MLTYYNFELQIIEIGGGLYQSRVVASPVGIDPIEAPSHDFRMAYDDDTLGRVLLALSGEYKVSKARRQEIARKFGETLFRMAFGGDVFEAYQAAKEAVISSEKALRVRLNLNRAGDLASLPWEFLRDPKVDFLALSKKTPLVRSNKQIVNRQRLEMSLPLRVLVMISAPDDVPSVNEDLERERLIKATEALRRRGLVELEFLEDASLIQLRKTLRSGEFHVFHYIGHSAFDPQSQTGMLLLEDPYNHQRSYPIRGEALARELQDEDTLRLVVLNSCEGAQADVRDPFSGVASSLVQRGMPAVVAQQFEITNQAAIAFSEEFYRVVAEGYSIEAALSDGRRAIVSTLDNTEWATPVLFLHENDKQPIFDFPTRGEQQRMAWTSRMPYVGVALATLLIVALMYLAATVFVTDDEAQAGFAPPTATPIPDVDLVISDVRLSPRNPQPGEVVAVFVDIQNRGTDDSPPFSYEWQPSIADSDQVISQRVEGLAAGGILRDSLAFRYGWWGTFITETRLDTLNEIVEDAEQNSRTLPVITQKEPLRIDFNEALPNGDFVTDNQPVAFDTFVPWGFRLQAEADDAACREVVPWFKFIGVSRVALGTGLPTNPDECTDETLILIFPDTREDTNEPGLSAMTVAFAPGSGTRQLLAFSDVEGQSVFADLTEANDPRSGLRLETGEDFLTFSKIFRVSITSQNAPLAITSFSMSPP